MGIKPWSSGWVQAPKICFCLIFLNFPFFAPFLIFHAKNMKKPILNRVWSAQHLQTGQKIYNIPKVQIISLGQFFYKGLPKREGGT